MMIRSFKMRKAVVFFLAFVFLSGGTSFGAKALKYRAFTPNSAEKSVFLKSAKSQRKYFIVNKGTSFGMNVVGPAKVRIRTRAEIAAGIQEVDYEFQVWEGDRLIDGRKVKSKPSLLVADGLKTGIGVARSIIISVPKGKHSYRLWIVSDKTNKIFARFYQSKKPMKKAEFINYKPYEFKKQVTLAAGKKPVTYYLIDQTGGVTLSVVGPTRIQIYCRASFDKNMKGSAKFSLGLFEKGQQAAIFPGVTKASNKVAFKEMADIIPSYLSTFTFSVPDGKHVYELKKVDSAAPSLAVKFKIMKIGLGIVP
jgi:hypothetical protein